jgi:DNA ligase D-like protein (predicted ligase)
LAEATRAAHLLHTLRAVPSAKAGFIEPMLLLRGETLPDDESLWLYEVKYDGFRAVAFKTGGEIYLRSRNDKDFGAKYPALVKALAPMPNETVIDGEIVALDESGRPSFNALQNYGSSRTPLLYYVFDVMMLSGKDVMSETLTRRRVLLQRVLAKLDEPVRESPSLEASLSDLVSSVKAQGLEGLVAKMRNGRYEPGLRSGTWRKMRINLGQEFVIAGYTPGPRNFDALIFGYYEGRKLIYVARTRNGFTPASRETLFKQFKGLETSQCPFANLPEPRGGRWGQGLTAAKMNECKWLKPVLVGQFEFLEWTPDNHLRHSRFMGLRDDKDARKVVREG